eukprot:CAMPEP_0194498296 /NCGR_PEP_ID=MMETSP0253-20130528/14970_1 /TAXON_ID=2966 /ORGANISM="Noctiluca scintillans" /LENGTH=50 /DNA_ID=CAMNT_0039339915 /DNA_START=244 /DNA_END=393 /DNA_ORIENTATION=-
MRIKGASVQQLVLEDALLPEDTGLVRIQVSILLKTFKLSEDRCIQQTAQP